MKLKNILALVLFCAGTIATAQNISLRGEVFDALTHKPLSDVNVQIYSDSLSSVLTGADGEFKFEIRDKNTRLQFSYPGYRTQVMALNSRKAITVYLLPENKVSVIENFAGKTTINQTAFTYDELLNGKVAGVNITKRSGVAAEGGNISIRGIRSLYGLSNPLIVLDGMPITQPPFESAVDGYIENALKDVDVKDIEKITVLKNGTGIYGSRAAGGVILIETKSAKEAKTYIDFVALGGCEFTPKKIPMMNSLQYKSYLVENLKTEGMGLDDILVDYPWLDGGIYPMLQNNTDWQQEVYDASPIQNYYLNVRGGDAMAKYSLSLGYMDKRNPLGEVGSQRYNTHLNGEMQIIEKLKMKAHLGYSVSNINLLPFGINSDLNPVTATLLKAPIFSPYQQMVDDSGNIKNMNILSDTDIFGMTNPMSLVEKTSVENKGNHLIGSVAFEYDIVPDIKGVFSAGIDYNKVRQDLFIPSNGLPKLDGIEYDRKATRNVQSFISFYGDFRLNYQKRFMRNHAISAFLGVNYQSSTYKLKEGTDYAMPNDEFKGLGSGSSSAASSSLDMKRVGSTFLQWKTASIYGSFNYDYANKYGGNVEFSINGSSNYANNAGAFFPSVSVYWNMSEEKWLNSLRWLDLLKVRATISSLGNDGLSNIAATTLYNSRRYRNTTGLVLSNPGNNQLEWEVTNQFNAGLDLSILGERLMLTMDYYLSQTNNLLMWNNGSLTYGLGGYWDNNGKLRNTGFEIGLSSRLLQGDFKWDIAATVAKNKSVIKDLNDNKSIINSIPGGHVITSEGNSPTAFYGLGKEGNLEILGDAFPDWYGGFSTTCGYKGIECTLDFTYKIGNDAFNYTRMLVEGMQTKGNQSVSVVNKPISTTDISMRSMSYRWIEDASFLRLNKIRLAYDVPYKGKWLQDVTVFAEADNVFTWSKYLGYNSEFSYSDSPFYAGVDYGKMPYGASIVFGVKLGL